MDSKEDLMSAAPFLKALVFILDYLSYTPLTYMVLYCFSMALVLVVDSPFETIFIKMLLLILGIKEGSVTLSGADIMHAFFIWWLILGTLFKLLKRFFGINSIRKILLFLLLAVGGTLSLVAKIKSFYVPFSMLGVFIISFFAYYLLSEGSNKVQSLIR